MKTFVLTLMLTLGMPLFCGAVETAKDLWLALSVEVQNVSYEYLRLHPGAGVASDMVAKDLEPVERALDRLLEQGLLVEKTIRLAPRESIGDDGVERVAEFVDALAQKHGQFVALYLMDLGRQ